MLNKNCTYCNWYNILIYDMSDLFVDIGLSSLELFLPYPLNVYVRNGHK